jgi:soluble lytic murein transglycosylase-like protein
MIRSASRPRVTRLARAATALGALGVFAVVGTADYIVQDGDTLSEIAQRNGTTIAAIAEANGLEDPYVLLPGQELALPGASSGATPAGGGVRHEVRAGEALSGIASRYRVRTSDIAAANDLGDGSLIRIGQRLVIPGGAVATAAAASSSRAEVEQLLERTAGQYGWNPAFVKAVAWQESGWNNQAVSSVGAVGIMQVMPETGDFVSRYLVGRELDLSVPEDNVLAGVAYLDYLHDLTGGDRRMILGGYYQGLRSISENGVYDETVRYADNILELKKRFS